MDTSVVDALIRSRSLGVGSLRGLVTAVAAMSPDRLRDVADRSDLDSGTRADLVRAVRRHEVVPMLERWPADVGLVETAEAVHGAEPSLVVYCAAQGWLVMAREMATRLRPDDVRSVPHLWEGRIGVPIPEDVRLALLDALMVPGERRAKLAEMTQRERDSALKRIEAEEERRAQAVWALLEPVPHLWAGLARDSKHVKIVQSVLLKYPDELSDEVLVACLPRVTLDDVRARLDGEVRMSVAARHVRRRPRLRVIAADAMRQIAKDAVDEGWTPQCRHLGPDWSGIRDLATLTDDPVLLAAAAAAVAAAEPARPPSSITRYYPDVPDEHTQRSDAIVALVVNPATPRVDLDSLLSTLDEQPLQRLLELADEDLARACRAQLDRLHAQTAARRPRYIPVPGDDELAGNADPLAVLHDHVRYLRGPAAQRDLTSEGLLRSRYTTPELLELLPARHVLGYADRAEQIAARIIEVCGDKIGRWEALAVAAQANPPHSMTFKAWLARLADPS